ncbi:MAG: hypothetical protein WCA46_30030 [Actinocatenispora sp.]
MDSNQYSFRVHLQSLKDFARELETQLDAIGKPSDGLAALSQHPVLLGDFAEADSLVSKHLTAVQQMHDLLGNVKSAIGFAGDVTDIVADSYEQTDADIAAALGQHTGQDTSIQVSYHHSDDYGYGGHHSHDHSSYDHQSSHGDHGSGHHDSGQHGSGQHDSGQHGSHGDHGSGHHDSGQHDSGKHGSGQHDSGQHDSGQHGSHSDQGSGQHAHAGHHGRG